ncbi:MAG: PEP-CTERM sorting domain-containing protein [Sedimentisphaerales bacterium]|nr:PEP-CTERM sorting domain-containing protein [Sedimentisphaerales bacterium]
MDAEYYSTNIFKPIPPIPKHFIRYIGILLLTTIIFHGLAIKAKATPVLSDFSRAGTYIDNQWYSFLDHGQYQYLDRGQYHSIGKPDYFLGFPLYPKIDDKEFDQSVGFTNIVNKGRFAFWGTQVPIIRYALWSTYDFSHKDYFYNRPYYFSDKGQYNYLEKGQYNLLGVLPNSFNRTYYRNQLQTETTTTNVITNPEPSTIGFFGLGAIVVIVLRKKRRVVGLT